MASNLLCSKPTLPITYAFERACEVVRIVRRISVQQDAQTR